MASLREYFESDFGYGFRFHIKMPFRDGFIEGMIIYDFASWSAFLALYVPDDDKDIEFFLDLIAAIEYGRTKVNLDGKVSLPLAKEFPGQLQVENKTDFELLAQYFGDTEWMSTKHIPASKRVFIYSETDLPVDEIAVLKRSAKERGLEAQFRSDRFAQERSRHEPPLAFISHDSRDKDIARRIAVKLQELRCTVWYDEFSLKVGDNLRDSIEKGLKECRKCVLVLSPSFISNKGWTRTEFDSIFTRQILEEEKLALPVWYQVGKKDVYDYSPSLSNVYGLNWEQLGEEQVCRKLHSAVMNQ
ncbi:MAG: toll/interleukin-1 receptor domain-containing protein [Desulfomonile tiedjei]|nr:toll/interleukin-1 receptor domain-containing protein [Desulfomonile tiedjei]